MKKTAKGGGHPMVVSKRIDTKQQQQEESDDFYGEGENETDEQCQHDHGTVELSLADYLRLIRRGEDRQTKKPPRAPVPFVVSELALSALVIRAGSHRFQSDSDSSNTGGEELEDVAAAAASSSSTVTHHESGDEEEERVLFRAHLVVDVLGNSGFARHKSQSLDGGSGGRSAYAVLPLFSTATTIIKSIDVKQSQTHQQDSDTEERKDRSSVTSSKLGTTTDTTAAKSDDTTVAPASQTDQDIINVAVGVHDGSHCVFIHRRGTYLINAEFWCIVTRDKASTSAASLGAQRSVLLSLPPATKAVLDLRIPHFPIPNAEHHGINVKIDPAIILSQQDITESQQSTGEASSSSASASTSLAMGGFSQLPMTVIKAQMRATSDLSIQWLPLYSRIRSADEIRKTTTAQRDKASTAAEIAETKVAVEQHTLFTIGEGILACVTTVDARILAAGGGGTAAGGTGISVFEVELDPRVSVLSVSELGSSDLLKKWEIIETDKPKLTQRDTKGKGVATSDTVILPPDNDEDITQAVPQDENAPLLDSAATTTISPASSSAPSQPAPEEAGKSCRILRLQLRYPTQQQYSFVITSEIELPGTTCTVELPVFRCKDVNREKGYIGIEAKTSVEIAETLRRGVGVAKVDARELPRALSSSAQHPILLAYKWLSPHYRIAVSVTKNADVEVVVAAISECQITITASEDGKVLYFVQMNVKNTERQFLRIDTPSDAEIWSTTVQDNPAKPARDGDQKLMIPLIKSSDTFVVTLCYLSRTNVMKSNSSLQLPQLPRLDIPISHLFVQLFLPQNHKYGRFSGMEKVEHFSTQPHFSGVPSRYAPVPPQPRRQMPFQRPTSLVMQVPMTNVMMQQVQCLGEEEEQMPYPAQEAKSTMAGVIPIKVNAIQSGREFLFEKLLVLSNDKINLSVRHRKIPKSALLRLLLCFPCC